MCSMFPSLNITRDGYNANKLWQPGPPNSATTQGAGSMMEVGYVAVYTSNA